MTDGIKYHFGVKKIKNKTPSVIMKIEISNKIKYFLENRKVIIYKQFLTIQNVIFEKYLLIVRLIGHRETTKSNIKLIPLVVFKI